MTAALRLANSYSRLPVLLELWHDLQVEHGDWLAMLGSEWSTCDNIAQHLDVLVDDSPLGDVLDGTADRRPLMDQAEYAAWEALPETVTVWRGCYAFNKWGLSWSLDRDVAARFPTLHRYLQPGAQPLLVRALARKDRIAAVKLDRGEAEIITHRPRHISTSYIRN